MTDHRRRPFTPLLLLLAAALTAGGCAGFRPPAIELADVRMADRSGEAAAFDFELALENPNDEPVELRELRYTLSLEGEPVYEGRRAAMTTLHPGAVSRIALPAVVRFERAGWSAATLPAGATYELRGTLLYVTPGALAEILLDTGVRRPTVSFAQGGSLTFAANP